MSQLSVEAATLHQAAKDVRAARGDVSVDVGRVAGEVGQALEGGWQGAAGTACQTLLRRWTEDAQRVVNALDNIADMLDKSGTAHAAADDQSNSAVNNITAGLGG